MKKEIEEWQEISRELIFEKFGRGVEKVIFRLPSGKNYDVYIKNEKPVVCILPITTDNKILLARQYCPGSKKYS